MLVSATLLCSVPVYIYFYWYLGWRLYWRELDTRDRVECLLAACWWWWSWWLTKTKTTDWKKYHLLSWQFTICFLMLYKSPWPPLVCILGILCIFLDGHLQWVWVCCCTTVLYLQIEHFLIGWLTVPTTCLKMKAVQNQIVALCCCQNVRI